MIGDCRRGVAARGALLRLRGRGEQGENVTAIPTLSALCIENANEALGQARLIIYGPQEISGADTGDHGAGG